MLFNADAHLLQLRGDRFKVFGDHVGNGQPASGCRRSHHIRAGLDHIRNDRISHAVQRIHALDFDDIGTRADDVGAARIEEVGQVDHMRLLCRILDYRLPLRFDSGKHNVDRGADGNNIHIDIGCLKPRFGRIAAHIAADHAHLCAERLKTLHMLVDGTHAEVAAARTCGRRLTKTPQLRTEHIIGRTHIPRQIIGCAATANNSGINLNCRFIDHMYFGAHRL